MIETQKTERRAFGKCLCVAATLPGYRWEARILPVHGVNHETEELAVMALGNRLPETVALAIFRRWPKNDESYAE